MQTKKYEGISIFTPHIFCRLHVVLFETLEFNNPLQPCPPMHLHIQIVRCQMHNELRHALAHVCTHAYRHVLSHPPFIWRLKPLGNMCAYTSSAWSRWAESHPLRLVKPTLPAQTRKDPIGLCIYCIYSIFVWVCRCLFGCVRMLAVQCLKHNLHAQFMMMHHVSDSAWLIRRPDPEALLLGYSAIMDKCAPQIYVCKCRMGELPPAATAHANLHWGWQKKDKGGANIPRNAWTIRLYVLVALIKIGALLWHYCVTNIIRGLYLFDLISKGNAICSNPVSGKNTSNSVNCIRTYWTITLDFRSWKLWNYWPELGVKWYRLQSLTMMHLTNA